MRLFTTMIEVRDEARRRYPGCATKAEVVDGTRRVAINVGRIGWQEGSGATWEAAFGDVAEKIQRASRTN